jgi:hypothetical protein
VFGACLHMPLKEDSPIGPQILVVIRKEFDKEAQHCGFSVEKCD